MSGISDQRFTLCATPLSGLVAVNRHPVSDHRGRLDRVYCVEAVGQLFEGRAIAQVNHTLTRRRGAVRGLHFQYPPFAEDKLVTCIAGSVFDVAVDLRKGSPTFLQWHGEVLAAANNRSLLIPRGFAHGFQVLSDESQLLYLHTAVYRQEKEGGLHPRDPRIAISWPEEITEMSVRDSNHEFVTTQFTGVDR